MAASRVGRVTAPEERPGQALTVFAHLNAEKAGLYRGILRIFMDAKAAFSLHLRPAEVVVALRESAAFFDGDSGGAEAELQQLCGWGNLEAHRDFAEVATAEDFYRPRYLYQLTAEGEAAERAMEVFYEVLQQPGELQTTALLEIRQYLAELVTLAEAGSMDDGRVIVLLTLLTERFTQLTNRAQMFMRSLQQRIDPGRAGVERFLQYKQSLIEYLERFVGELVIATHEVSAHLQRVEAAGVDRLLEPAACRDVADMLEEEKPARLLERRRHWRARWSGLRGWFLGGEGRTSQAETLRARARSAVPALLSAVQRFNDQRSSRSDRVADLLTLARWFATAPTEKDAHRLWRAAFALGPARHLKVDEETLERREERPVPAQTSWLAAEPIRMSPRIRQLGRHVAKGSASKVIDRRQEKELLARLAREEVAQIEEAQRRLAIGRRMRLSELGALEKPAEFDLLLDLLGEALAAKTHSREKVTAHSSDGALSVVLEPVDDGAEVTLVTSDGFFRGDDHFVTIRSAFG